MSSLDRYSNGHLYIYPKFIWKCFTSMHSHLINAKPPFMSVLRSAINQVYDWALRVGTFEGYFIPFKHAKKIWLQKYAKSVVCWIFLQKFVGEKIGAKISIKILFHFYVNFFIIYLLHWIPIPCHVYDFSKRMN